MIPESAQDSSLTEIRACLLSSAPLTGVISHTKVRSVFSFILIDPLKIAQSTAGQDAGSRRSGRKREEYLRTDWRYSLHAAYDAGGVPLDHMGSRPTILLYPNWRSSTPSLASDLDHELRTELSLPKDLPYCWQESTGSAHMGVSSNVLPAPLPLPLCLFRLREDWDTLTGNMRSSCAMHLWQESGWLALSVLDCAACVPCVLEWTSNRQWCCCSRSHACYSPGSMTRAAHQISQCHTQL